MSTLSVQHRVKIIECVKHLPASFAPLGYDTSLKNGSFSCTCDNPSPQQDTKLEHAEYHNSHKAFPIASSDLIHPLHLLSQLCRSLLLSSLCAVCLFLQYQQLATFSLNSDHVLFACFGNTGSLQRFL